MGVREMGGEEMGRRRGEEKKRIRKGRDELCRWGTEKKEEKKEIYMAKEKERKKSSCYVDWRHCRGRGEEEEWGCVEAEKRTNL